MLSIKLLLIVITYDSYSNKYMYIHFSWSTLLTFTLPSTLDPEKFIVETAGNFSGNIQ